MHYPVVIAGAGPAGLACAQILAGHGIRTLVVEKKEEAGPKVCAGGLTWSGLANQIPADLIEQSFSVQHIRTRLQQIAVRSTHPIIVTVNRAKLGRYMRDQALASGAEILCATRVTEISNHTVTLQDIPSRQKQQVQFDYLVGADGSNSSVRKFLGLRSLRMGIGITYQIPGRKDTMEWHLDSSSFKNGYGWIFPHRTTMSVGAYVDGSVMKANVLKHNLIRWAAGLGIDLTDKHCKAEYINFDFQGWDFGHIFLAGDAAGLASALTGEGIYPAIVSGSAVAQKIVNPHCSSHPLERMIKKHRLHARLIRLTGRNPVLNALLGELAVLGLRCRILNFRHLEMAD